MTEVRYTTGTVELRADDGQSRIGGYALKFNRLSRNLGGFVEQIATSALTKTLKDGGDVLCRYQHEDELLLGRTMSGTLRLSVDEVGLLYEVDLPETSYARDLAALASRGDVQHSSFAFQVMPGGDSWSLTEDGFPLRTLTELHLVDVAPVVNPAYLDTSSGLRSLAEARHLDLDSVRAAAEAEQLADLLRADDVQADAPGETHAQAIARKRLVLSGHTL